MNELAEEGRPCTCSSALSLTTWQASRDARGGDSQGCEEVCPADSKLAVPFSMSWMRGGLSLEGTGVRLLEQKLI